MAKRKILLVLTLGLALMYSQAPAMARDYGLTDRSGVWRDAEYWHANYPDWVYQYHPEWVVDREDWWVYDYRAHPEWFQYPFWQEYPIWTYGAYDQQYRWHYAGWWREHNPAWFYANHPRWAEPFPNWIRADHAAHPEWFRSAYWHEHPHDWNHPDEAYRSLRKAEYEPDHRREYSHQPELSHRNGEYSLDNSERLHGGTNYAADSRKNYSSNYAANDHSKGPYGSPYHSGSPNYSSFQHYANTESHALAASHPSGGGGGSHHH